MNHLEVSATKFTDLSPAPTYVSAAWNPFTLHVVDGPLHMEAVFADHVLGLHISGNHRVRQEVSGRARESNSRADMVTLIPAHRNFRCDATAPARFIVLFLPVAFLSRVISEHWQVDPSN